MSFEPPDGILDIGNATLRVGKLEVAETSGLNQGLLNIVKNNLLITENTEYASSNTWGIKLPTTWVAEFDVKGHSEKYVEFNFYNEDKTSNTSGYTLNFKDTSLTLKYDNGTTLASATIPTIVDTYRKVNIFFERNVIAVSIDGTRVLYDKRPSVLSRVISTTGSAFVNVFIEQNASNSAFKNLRIVNGRFISDKTSNIAFIGGNLGVGVNSPKETLDIRGNMHFNRVSNVSSVSVDSNVVTEYTGPHDRPLRKYPEVAMTANDNSSTSGYVADQTAYSGNADGYAYRLFDHSLSTAYQSGGSQYSGGDSTSSAQTTTATDGTTHQGVAITLDLATKIRLSYAKITSHTYYGRTPVEGTFLGSNNNSTWDVIGTFAGLSTTASGQTHTVHIADYATKSAYRYIRLVVTKVHTSAVQNGGSLLEFKELEYYGHEEGSGSLDTTLKTVYNVPETTGTQLEVYYDAKDLATMPTTVTDLSPNSNDGTPTNVTVSDGAFVFNGTSSLLEKTSLSIPGGDNPLTFSFWLKNDDFDSSQYILRLGDNTTTYQTVALYKNSSNQIIFASWTLDFPIDYTFTSGQWNHISLVYPGGGWKQSNLIAYVDGKPYTFGGNVSVGGVGGTVMSLATSLTLRIGGFASGNTHLDGSIANFRLYSKALNAEQVQELYDYQKDYFLGSKSQVTLYKGHLGVGVTEPSGQLELAGDERIQEYPPRAMTGWETYMEGHGVFRAGKSGHDDYLGNWDRWKVFNKGFTTSGGVAGDSYHGEQSYSSSTGLYTGVGTQIESLGGISGDYFILDMPYKISLKHINVTSSNQDRSPTEFIILGSNDGSTWTQIKHFSSAFTGAGQTLPFQVNSNEYFSYFGLVVTKIVASNGYLMLSEWQLFGTPGPTTLDKGSLTLGRSLDVPRISRYDVDTETPRPEKLLVDFDTTVNRWPVDISGKFNDGAFYNGASYSPADKAFTFDGTDDYIDIPSVSGVGTGAWVHSKSFWFKLHSSTDPGILFLLGRNGSTKQIAVQSNGSGQFQYYIYGCNSRVQVNGADWFPDVNRWYHCVTIFKNNETTAAGGVITGREMYIDGVKQTLVAINTQVALNLDSSQVRFGNQFNTNYLDYQLSNPKLYSVALEPSEVKKLYNLGRTGRSMVISDTAVGIGKAPEAQLDVRGVTRFDGRVGIGTNVPNFALHIHGNNKGVTATTGNQWINWLTNPNYNGTYNGDSPSYPVTTHASMTNTMVYSRHSIGCSGYLWSHGSTLNMSDRRVKTNIVDVNDDTCLRTLRQLKPKHYNYINIRERGSDPVWGFIAQEVKEAIPYSTTLKTDYIPNIDEKARLLDDGRTIVFTNFNTASLESNATTIRILNKNQDEFDITLTEVLDPNTIRVEEDITEHTFVYDQEDDNGNVLEGNYVYVYGQEIDDFVYLKKDAIWTVTTAALQEVDRQLQYERARNDALEARVTVLEQAKYM